MFIYTKITLILPNIIVQKKKETLDDSRSPFWTIFADIKMNQKSIIQVAMVMLIYTIWLP
jgi:hypothetical protein